MAVPWPSCRHSDFGHRCQGSAGVSMRPRVLNRYHHIDELGTSTFLELPDAFRSLTDGLRSRLSVRIQARSDGEAPNSRLSFCNRWLSFEAAGVARGHPEDRPAGPTATASHLAFLHRRTPLLPPSRPPPRGFDDRSRLTSIPAWD